MKNILWRIVTKQIAFALLLSMMYSGIVISVPQQRALAQNQTQWAVVPGFNTHTIGPNDDGSSAFRVMLPFFNQPIRFFGQQYTGLWVNNNGNVTFDEPLSEYTPFSLLSTEHPMIAPFFADVDTRGEGSGLTYYGAGAFNGRQAFGVTWAGVGVGYYNTHVDRLNKFQMLIVERFDTGPGDFDIVFNYDQIQWETGDASDGTNGLGGFSARVGFSNGSTTSFEMPGSAQNGAFLDGGPRSLRTGTNVGVPGRWIFPVRNGISRVYTRSSMLVNGSGLPDCPAAGPIIEPCTTVANGYTLGYGAESGFSDLHMLTRVQWPEGTSGDPFSITFRHESGDVLTFTAQNYSGPANVRYTYSMDGNIHGTGFCSATAAAERPFEPNGDRRRGGPSATFDGACSTGTSTFQQTVNGSLTDLRVHTGNSNQQQELGAQAYANGGEIHFGSGQFNQAQTPLIVVHELAHVMQQTSGAQPRAEGQITGNLSETITLVNVLVTDPNGNPIPGITLTSESGAHYPLDPANLAGVPTDSTAPGITPIVSGTLGTNGWYISNVAVSWSVSDAESAITSSTGCGSQTVAADTTAITFTCSASSSGGSATQSVTVKRDATAPSLSPAMSPDPILLNGSGAAVPNAADVISGLAAQSCTPLITARIGTKTATCTATDNAGNTASATIPYAVTYGIRLLYDPTQAKNAGSTYPIKLDLVDALGVRRSSSSITLTAVNIRNAAGGPHLSPQSPGNSQPNNLFRFEAGSYHFNLKTNGLSSGSWLLDFTVAGDPVRHSAPFRIR